MKITILTLFPEMFLGPFDYSILKRAQKKKLLDIKLVNIRRFGIGKHKIVDDKPYGGGVGMIMRFDVVKKAVESAKCENKKCKEKIILLSPQGKVFNQKIAYKFTQFDHLILICGHYEGFDERIRKMVDEEISIGDYVLTGGELATMVIIDAVIRLIPGVLGKDQSSKSESFQEFVVENSKDKLLEKYMLLEYPHYTRPAEFKGLKVPSILLSGNHQKVLEWRKKEAYKRTKKRRPDLLKRKSV